MCYLCMKDGITFGLPKQPDKRRERAKALKQLITEIDSVDDDKCDVGDAMYELLREEQYSLAREM